MTWIRSLMLLQAGQWFCRLITWTKPTCWVTASPSSPKGSCTVVDHRSSWRTVLELGSTWRLYVGWRISKRRRWGWHYLTTCSAFRVNWIIKCVVHLLQNDCDCASDCSCNCSICTSYKDQSQNQAQHLDRVPDGKVPWSGQKSLWMKLSWFWPDLTSLKRLFGGDGWRYWCCGCDDTGIWTKIWPLKWQQMNDIITFLQLQKN